MMMILVVIVVEILCLFVMLGGLGLLVWCGWRKLCCVGLGVMVGVVFLAPVLYFLVMNVVVLECFVLVVVVVGVLGVVPMVVVVVSCVGEGAVVVDGGGVGDVEQVLPAKKPLDCWNTQSCMMETNPIYRRRSKDLILEHA